MATTVSNFLVGLGFTVDDQSMRQAEGAIDSLSSKALQAGGILAGAFGTKALTFDFAQMTDSVGKFSQVFGLIPEDITAFGRAIEHEGGTLDGFMGQLQNLEQLRAGLLRGDAGFISAAGMAGLDVGPLVQATNATEGFLALADQFQTMTQQQRLNAAQALGLDPASIRLLSQGSTAIEELVDNERRLRPLSGEMTKAGAAFNDATQDLWTNVGGIADRISTTLLPEITAIIEGTNQWIDSNRKLINQGLDKVLDPIAENFGAVATAGTILASGGLLKALAGMARFIPIIGAGLATAAGATASLAPAVAAMAVGASVWDWSPDDFERTFGVRPPDWLFQPIGELVGGSNESITAGTTAPAGNTATAGGSQRPAPIQVNLTMDGQVIERKIIDVNSRNNELTLDELTN